MKFKKMLKANKKAIVSAVMYILKDQTDFQRNYLKGKLSKRQEATNSSPMMEKSRKYQY